MPVILIVLLIVLLIAIPIIVRVRRQTKMMDAQITEFKRALDRLSDQSERFAGDQIEGSQSLRDLRSQINMLRQDTINERERNRTTQAYADRLMDLEQQRSMMDVAARQVYVPESMREEAQRMTQPRSSMSSMISSISSMEEMTSSMRRETEQQTPKKIEEEKRKEKIVPREKRSRYESLEIE